MKTVIIKKQSNILIVLFIIFLVLKLCNVITWSWFWVTFPLLLPIYGFLAIMALFVLAFVAFGICQVATIPWKGTNDANWGWVTKWKLWFISFFR